MKNIYTLLFLFFLVLSQDVRSQQDPQYTQYMYNMSIVNPAYAGSKEGLTIGVLGRDQWMGFDGAPRTFSFSAHSPVADKIGAGFSAIVDENGPVKETNVYADIAYTISLDTKHQLAFGLKSGATFHDVGLIDLELQDFDDVAFQENINESYFNIGAGVYLYTQNYYVGVSVPNFLNSKHLVISDNGNETEYGSEVQHLFATAGYVYELNDDLKLKPSVLFKTAFGAPASFDVNINALLYNKFEGGLSYRYEDAISALVGFRATDQIQLGFAYDYTLSDIEEPSLEAFLIFNVVFNKSATRSPRYF